MSPFEKLRWYKSDKIADYSLQHWWQKEGEVERGVSAVDGSNEILWEKNERGRAQIRLEPWLWEILRRHPELKSIREEYHAINESIHETGFDTFNREKIAFLEQWKDRGPRLIEQLAKFGHLSWAVKKGGPNENLSLIQQQEFSSSIAGFSVSKANFPNGKSLPAQRSISVPILLPKAEDLTAIDSKKGVRPKSPEDFSLGDYQQAARKRGRELILFEVDQDISPGALAKEVEEWAKSRRSEETKQFRLGESRLELLEQLDSDSDFAPEILIRIENLFSDFRLSA